MRRLCLLFTIMSIFAVGCTEGNPLDDNIDHGNNSELPGGDDDDTERPNDGTKFIRFIDNTVKTICLVHWDTNGDDELSYNEAAAVTDIGTKFTEATIISFDEFKYFTGVTEIAPEAFIACSNLAKITIPNSVTTIGEYAFCDCHNLSNVTIGNSVTTIGECAFGGCSSLTSVTIPNSVTTIGERAFGNCSSFTSVTIPDSVTTIEKRAFQNCLSLQEFNGKFASEDGRCLILNGELISFAPANLIEYSIPNSVTSIGEYAFGSCSSLTSITIPNSVTTIRNDAFYNCTGELIINSKFIETDNESDYYNQPHWMGDFTKLTIGNNISKIGRMVFCGCERLTSVTIGNSVTTIGEGAFYWCDGLTDVTIPDSVTTIGDGAFYHCDGLKSVTIGNSVTTIGERAFYECDGLTDVTIPDRVTTIGEQAFDDCDGLTSVYCKPTIPPTGNTDMFDDDIFRDIKIKIYVPTQSVGAYMIAPYWKDYADNIVGYDFEN